MYFAVPLSYPVIFFFLSLILVFSSLPFLFLHFNSPSSPVLSPFPIILLFFFLFLTYELLHPARPYVKCQDPGNKTDEDCVVMSFRVQQTGTEGSVFM